MFAVKTSILRELCASDEWKARLCRAENVSEVGEVVKAFCRVRGYRVKEIALSTEGTN